jgi:long-chain acyl-CoA synthetase
VGPPLRDVEVRIADDGEILVRGELVMRGYWNKPEATAEVLRNGWLHTGDIGVIDSDGYLQITDRKKDIIVNSGGDNIAPQRVEGFLALQPEICQAMVYGDKRPYLVALIVPDTEFAAAWARAHGQPIETLPDVPAFRKEISAAIDRTSAELSIVERVRKFIIVPQPFTVENNMMTPSLKIRRHVIRAAYRDRLEALY